MSAGKSVRLFLADGTTGGLLTAEIMNWTGHVVAAPRSELGALLKRSEADRTGIYLLIGDDPASLGGTLTYVGEGDAVGKRLVQHARPEEQKGKDFWQRAIILTSKDANLTKADESDMEYFVSQAKIVLPVLGINILRSAAVVAGRAANGRKNWKLPGGVTFGSWQTREIELSATALDLDDAQN